jgi:flagellar biosynthesis component FlhA
MAENRVTSIAAEALATPASQARATSIAAEVLATASSEARVSLIAAEALVLLAEAPGGPAAPCAIVMVLGA